MEGERRGKLFLISYKKIKYYVHVCFYMKPNPAVPCCGCVEVQKRVNENYLQKLYVLVITMILKNETSCR